VTPMTLDEARAHIGDGVIYHSCGCEADRDEEGVITSVNDRFVFVCYGVQGGGVATDPADLTLLAGKVPGDG
jgi:hypothetical protein